MDVCGKHGQESPAVSLGTRVSCRYGLERESEQMGSQAISQALALMLC